MKNYGLEREPAFENLIVAIEPITKIDGRYPLGLYYQYHTYAQSPLIHLPPETPSPEDINVAVHELGHRFNDYYYGDMSEESAERFRECVMSGIPYTHIEKPEPKLDISLILLAGVSLLALNRRT